MSYEDLRRQITAPELYQLSLMGGLPLLNRVWRDHIWKLQAYVIFIARTKAHSCRVLSRS